MEWCKVGMHYAEKTIELGHIDFVGNDITACSDCVIDLLIQSDPFDETLAWAFTEDTECE